MPKDILLDQNFDLQISNGDFVIGEATEQHQQLLIATFNGEWKENPTVGVGAEGFLKDDDAGGFLAEVKSQFEKDGMTFNEQSFNNGILKVDAAYNY